MRLFGGALGVPSTGLVNMNGEEPNIRSKTSADEIMSENIATLCTSTNQQHEKHADIHSHDGVAKLLLMGNHGCL